jgi:ABC-type transport system involved in cytochrome bd biosynthesis fused ATPase/permease subunit
MDLLVTTAAIAWLDQRVAPIAMLAALLGVVIPLGMHPVLSERDLRLRCHEGAMARFYLDSLLGLVPIRTHGAEPAVSSEHEGLLVEWMRAARLLVRSAIAAEAVQAFVGLVVAVWIVFAHVATSRDPSSTLLLIYWALALPVIAEQLAMAARQYPSHRNVTLRLLEPLGALDERPDHCPEPQRLDHPLEPQRPELPAQGTAFAFEGVSVVAAGHAILEEIDLRVEAGSHVAIVGPSGAGKSTLVGLLLGWHVPASGRFLVNGAPLDGQSLAELRRHSAWVDPGVQLWNRSLAENLHYGMEGEGSAPLGAAVVDAVHLRALLERLPDGLQTSLGESGALVSGGEGQRVRFGRAMLRRDVRLVILDEPFRGLDREERRVLLARARDLWKKATLLCITHDVRETMGFERALVIERGRIAEDGAPTGLARQPGSRYRAMLDAEDAVRSSWAHEHWRRVTLEQGRLLEARSADRTEKPA